MIKELENKLSKVIRHPDKEEIIKRLLAGESTREIEASLKAKYNKPEDRRYHVSYMTLQKFRSEELNLKKNIIDDITISTFVVGSKGL